MNSTFEVRGLEFNEPMHWRWDKIVEAVDYMKATGMNTLIFHQNDILNKVCFFHKYHNQQNEDLHKKMTEDHIHYMERVMDLCHRNGIKFYFEIKELSYEDGLLAAHPELYIEKGIIDARHELWVDFLETKVDEVLENLPMTDGIIINVSAPESRLKISDAPGSDLELTPELVARNERLKLDSIGNFYDQLLRAVHRPLAARGKELVVREFAWSSDSHEVIMKVIDNLPEDVVMGVKINSSDYWPTFPANPSMWALPNRKKWIEMDVWGENFCWSVIPCYRFEDYRKLLIEARSKAGDSITGVWCRVNWEAISNVYAPETLNDINLYGIAKAGQNIDTDPKAIFEEWLKEKQGWAIEDEMLDKVYDFFNRSLTFIQTAPYVRGHVFNRHCLLPESYEQEEWAIYGATRRGMWVPGADADIEMDKSDLKQAKANLEAIIAEKEVGKEMAADLMAEAKEIAAVPGCPEDFKAKLLRGWLAPDLYAESFYSGAMAYFSTRYLIECQEEAEVRDMALKGIEGLKQVSGQLKQFCSDHPELPHYFHFFYDHKRAQTLAESIEKKLNDHTAKEA